MTSTSMSMATGCSVKKRLRVTARHVCVITKSPFCHNIHQHVDGLRVLCEERAARYILGMPCQPTVNLPSNSPVFQDVYQNVKIHGFICEEGSARYVLGMYVL
jgi:hypothetical protein